MANRAHVACGSCDACCRGELIMLFPGDDASAYLTQDVVSPIDGSMAKALIQKPDGSCIYLSDAGCTIHARAPQICQSFDCVRLFKQFMSWPKADRRHPQIKSMLEGDVLRAGRERA